MATKLTVGRSRITNYSNISKKYGISLCYIKKKSLKQQFEQSHSHNLDLNPACQPLFYRAQISQENRAMGYEFTIKFHHLGQCEVSSKSTPATKEKEFSEELHKLSTRETYKFSPLNIKFGRLQRADQVAIQGDGFEYMQFVAGEAQIDEEYWAAAWLRAEAHWEDQENDRYAENYKRKFAEQEFNSLKTRCKTRLGDKCHCIVMANKEDQTVKRNVQKSVVGTLDLSYGYMSHGQSFPGELIKAPIFGFVNRKQSSKFGYIANLCVAKSARRKGIARNMLQFAISLAKKGGVKQVFAHVHGNNKPAQVLYQKMGFKVVDAATSQCSSHQTYLLSLKIQTTDR